MNWIEPVVIATVALALWCLHAAFKAYLEPKSSAVVKHAGNVISIEQRRKDAIERARMDLAMRIGGQR